jgi:hypothetical protein
MANFFKFLFEKYHPELKQIDRTAHLWVLLNGLPSRFHSLTPIDIIHQKNRVGMLFCQQSFKIV